MGAMSVLWGNLQTKNWVSPLIALPYMAHLLSPPSGCASAHIYALPLLCDSHAHM
jgi:hypothetical protein